MTIDVKALRALLAKATLLPWNAYGRGIDGSGPGRSEVVPDSCWATWCGAGTGVVNSDDADLIVAAVNALPDLLALAEAVQALTPAIRTLAHPTSDHPHAVAARRVLAILEPTNEGDGR